MSKETDIMEYFDEILPNAACELNYSKDYELVIAVMLSAQTTDKSVNQVTAHLFKDFPTLKSLADAKYEDIANEIRSLGLYQTKSKNIILIAKQILDVFDGKVPSDKQKLMTLPGVGNKTANVIRAEIFKIPEFPVDTHIARISKRLGLAKSDDDVLTIEKKLRRKFPRERYILLHHQFIHFGRYICKAKNPDCKNCKLTKYCRENKLSQQSSKNLNAADSPVQLDNHSL